MRKITEDGLCTVQGCERRHQAKTYCITHYRRWKNGQPLDDPITVINPKRRCAFENCRKPYKSIGYCGTHAEQARTGRTLTPISDRRKFKSALEKYWEYVRISETGCWEWTRGKTQGYGQFKFRDEFHLAHRFAYVEFVGPIGVDEEVDHQCRNRACSNPGHLKAVTRKENRENLGLDPRNRSGYRGVSLESRSGKWRAAVSHNYKQHYKSGFDTAEEANEYAVNLRNELYTNNVGDL